MLQIEDLFGNEINAKNEFLIGWELIKQIVCF